MRSGRILIFWFAHPSLAVCLWIAATVYVSASTFGHWVNYLVWQMPEGPEILPIRRAPTAPQKLDTAAARNLLALRREAVALPEDAAATAADASPPSGELLACTLQGALRATLVASDPALSRAMVVDSATQETRVVSPAVGSNRVDADTLLVEVRRLGMVVRRHGHLELCLAEGQTAAASVDLDAPLPVTVEQVTETHFLVDRHDLGRWFSDLPALGEQAAVASHWDGQHVDGFILGNVTQVPFLARLGLRGGDVVQRINGYDMDDATQMETLHAQLQRALVLVVKLQRAGRTLELHYKVK